MEYNLTSNQKSAIRWMVEANRRDELDEEFSILWINGPSRYFIMNRVTGTQVSDEGPQLSQSILDALESAGLIQQRVNYETKTKRSGTSKNPRVTEKEIETSRRCSLTQKAYDAVDSDFVAPDSPPTSAEFHFHGDVSQSIVGTQNRAELTNNFRADEVRDRIERDGGVDKEELLAALSRLEDLLESGEQLDRGALSEFSEVMERHSWFTGSAMSALLGFATQFVG